MECNLLVVKLVDGELKLVLNDEVLQALGIDTSNLDMDKISQLTNELVKNIIA